MSQPILRFDVHRHLYPPGYLEALVGSGRVTRERDANGTEVLPCFCLRPIALALEERHSR